MKKLALFFLLYCPSSEAQSIIQDINNTADNALEILGLLKKNKSNMDSSSSTTPAKNLYSPESSFRKTTASRLINCKEFCIENHNKKNAKIDIELQNTKTKQTLLVMSRDKSCLFDVPIGTYIVRVYIEDKLVKKTDFRLDDEEQELLTLPE